MRRSSSFWFGWPKEELSATERARQAARREVRLESHVVQAQDADAAAFRKPGTAPRAPVRSEQRDPRDLQQGVDVQELSESAYGKLFPMNEDVEDVDN